MRILSQDGKFDFLYERVCLEVSDSGKIFAQGDIWGAEDNYIEVANTKMKPKQERLWRCCMRYTQVFRLFFKMWIFQKKRRKCLRNGRNKEYLLFLKINRQKLNMWVIFCSNFLLMMKLRYSHDTKIYTQRLHTDTDRLQPPLYNICQ